jgi:hypothetical protein
MHTHEHIAAFDLEEIPLRDPVINHNGEEQLASTWVCSVIGSAVSTSVVVTAIQRCEVSAESFISIQPGPGEDEPEEDEPAEPEDGTDDGGGTTEGDSLTWRF